MEGTILTRKLADNRLLAPLLIAALLLCHGAFVSLHHPVAQSPSVEHPTLSVAAAPVVADVEPVAGEQYALGMGHVAAMIFALGTALGVWLAGLRERLKVRTIQPPLTAAPPCRPHPVRAPALASLQVFRL